jgi:hypothetical protein
MHDASGFTTRRGAGKQSGTLSYGKSEPAGQVAGFRDSVSKLAQLAKNAFIARAESIGDEDPRSAICLHDALDVRRKGRTPALIGTDRFTSFRDIQSLPTIVSNGTIPAV